MDKTKIAKEINSQFNITQGILDKFGVWVTVNEWANKCGVCRTDFYEVLKGNGSDNATKKVAEFFEIETEWKYY